MNQDQRARIEANRKKALERLKQRGILNKSQAQKIEGRNTKKPVVLESQKSVENDKVAPRQEIQPDTGQALQKVTAATAEEATQQITQLRDASTVVPNHIRPTIRKSDYIDYDFSTMENLNGGYINRTSSEFDLEYDSLGSKRQKTLDDWKREQKERRELYENKAPPEHMSEAVKCDECKVNIEMDPILNDIYKLNVCKSCAKRLPEKYSLLTKTECKEDYFLTEPELNDTSIFHRLEKPNPHSGTFARMQLFVRCEIEEFAFKKWGGSAGLDEEWQRRETAKLQRKEKKYNEQIKQMRLKTRAQEFTRKLQDKKYGSIHKHNFGEPIPAGKDDDNNDILKRRCIDCGLETVEISI
ncbi:hypothetical protein KAFR_0J02380 [Kazachstania africana CBS 2517]|uniref:XPA C-terminal domain-containing protein n=1 Tax=Kazachstania africana (strain ATCC 22294 / BCRC 22015 / CBS 2517 / CECT 1963 / NBRC 1671 / NRRL Y-8276) TaxID=1071382 RepID=H2B102_KAZAF|nr:hypothetical protein KAFR_0J02380 [Kazachstania africana CBS 2517]CCF60302.1 hypothetical protein KAFR_0J02380 [Kazachstania africana CBS 2517]